MFRLRVFLIGLTIALCFLLFANHQRIQAGGACPEVYCLYLPFTSSPAPVRVVQFHTANSYGDFLRVMGEITSTTNVPVYGVTLEMRAYDEANQLLGIFSRTPVFTSTLPGQLNPFDLGTNISTWEVYNIALEITNWSFDNAQTYAAPTIVMTDTLFTPNITYVTTTIRNDNAQALINVRGDAWSLKQWNSFYPQMVTDYLAPGETVTFNSMVYVPYFPTLPPTIRVAVQGILEP
ncbi:MAG TPA: hypothetical protein PK530_07555 [Anaerolineales bacterium]|nr:hypothetical protein [Anaerolineales bacterium]